MWKNLLCAAVLVAFCATPAFSANIGIFNARMVIGKCDASIAANKIIQDKFGARGNALEKQKEELQSQAKSFQAQAAAMSQKAREDKQTELMRKGRELDEKHRALMMEVEKANVEMSQTVMKIANDASANIAKKKKLDVLLNESSGAVAYATSALRVDEDILKELNRLWKAQGSKFPTKKSK